MSAGPRRDGPGRREAVRSLARHHGVADLVRFLGFVPDDDLPGLYRLADVFARSRRRPSCSRWPATMAAMASGLPVVVAVDVAVRSLSLVYAGRERLPRQARGVGRRGRRLPRPALPRPRACGRGWRRRPRASSAITAPASSPRSPGGNPSTVRSARHVDSRTREGERWLPLNSRLVPLLFLIGDTGVGGTAAPPRRWRRALEQGAARPFLSRSSCDPLRGLGLTWPRLLRWFAGFLYGPCIRLTPWLWWLFWRASDSPRVLAARSGARSWPRCTAASPGPPRRTPCALIVAFHPMTADPGGSGPAPAVAAARCLGDHRPLPT